MNLNAKTASITIALAVTVFFPLGNAEGQDLNVLEEIVVTAQKREQSIVDVPIAMSALSAQQIDKTRAKTIGDLQALAPNFSFENVNGFDNISIRGVGGGGRSIGFDPRSGLYIDGVYIGQAAALAQPLFGIERVEILRGPQGHLFGRNTVSGAVSLTTLGPSDEFTASVGAVAGNEETYEASATMSGPLGETVAGRIGAAYETRGGFGINSFTGSEIDDLERASIRGQLRFQSSDRLTIDVFADYSETETASPVGEAQTTGLFSGGTTFPALPRQVDTNTSPVDDNTVGGSSVTITYDMQNDFSFTSISAYRYAQQDRVNDTDYSAADALNIIFDDESNQVSQEFRLISPETQAIRYVLGLYYLDEEGKTNRIGHLGTAVGGPLDVEINSTVDTTTVAGFAAVDADISDTVTLNFGARYTSETKDVKYSLANGFAFGLAGTVPFSPLVSVADSLSENQFTPTIGLTIALNDQLNIYAKYTANGFKSGGFNTEFISDASIASGISFAPETVDSVEVGMKGVIAGGRVSFDVAVFSATYEDFQILQFVEVGPGLTDIQLRNAAEVGTQGFEAAARFFVTDKLQLGANFSTLDATFDAFPNAAGVGVNFDGNDLPNAPDFTGTLTVDYQIPVSSSAATIDIYGEFSHRAESFSNANNDPVLAHIPARDLLNGRITYTSDDGQWSVGLWARNLLDEDYVDLRNRDFLGNDFLRRGDPRTAGVEFKKIF